MRKSETDERRWERKGSEEMKRGNEEDKRERR
jgi:hypothetical protein